MGNDILESVYEKGTSLEEAVKSALQDVSDCPELSKGFNARVEAMLGWAQPARYGKAFKIAASIAACVALAGLVFAAAVVGDGLVGRGGDVASDAVHGDEPIAQEGTQAADGTEALSSASDADYVTVPSSSTYAPTKGETSMKKGKAALAVLSAALATTPLAASSGDEYQFIVSGELVAVTEGCSSDSSSTTSLTSGTLADGIVYDSELEARSRTTDESNTSSLSSDKVGMVILFK